MIEIRNLTKRFGPLTVLRELDLDVPAGSICGFIGPNGAGKTTTMRILATLEAPSSGSIRIAGLDAVADAQAVRSRVGYMPDYYGSYSDLVVSEYLEFFARAHKIGPAQRARRLQDVVEFTEVGRLLKRPVDALSKGEKQRLSLARALLPEPDLLLLDEPAAGLDPRARVELRELLKVLSARNKTIFISSHILTELSGLVDWVIVIDHGRIRYAGEPERAQRPHGRSLYVLELTTSEEEATRFLLEQPAVLRVAGGESQLMLELDETLEPADELAARLVGSGARFRGFYQQQADLEDVFMSVTQRRPSDAPPE